MVARRASQPPPDPAERLGLVVINLIKLGGLAVVLNEVFVQPELRTKALAVAALMMAGATSLESFFEHFFGGGKP